MNPTHLLIRPVILHAITALIAVGMLLVVVFGGSPYESGNEALRPWFNGLLVAILCTRLLAEVGYQKYARAQRAPT
mgnify:CR=1 FL=1